MPLKRTTRARPAPPASTPDPSLPESSAPKSDDDETKGRKKRTSDDAYVDETDEKGIVEIVTPEGRGKRIRLNEEDRRMLLENLDLEVKQRSSSLENYIETLCISLTARGNIEIQRLPKATRQLTIGEFCNVYNGNAKDYSMKEIRERADAYVSPIKGMSASRIPIRNEESGADKKPSKGRSKRTQSVFRELGIANTDVSPSKSPLKTRRQRNQLAAAGNEKPPIPKLKPSRSKQAADNASSMARSSNVLLDTTPTKPNASPIFRPTPKPNPYLTKTPVLRAPARGEFIMSINGSPLINPL